MSAGAQTADDYRTYGNWAAVRSPGLLGAGLLASAVLVFGLVFVMIAMFAFGFTAAVVLALAVLATFGLVGTSVGPTIARRTVFGLQRQAGAHQWRSGMTARTSSPANRLPGMLGRTRLVEYSDAFGQPFVVIHNPARGGSWTIVARCVADGPAMQDRSQVDTWVGRFARVLTVGAHEPAMLCMKAITDTAPDPGGRLHAMVDSLRDPKGPELARSVMDQVVADYPSASSENVTYVELTFRGRSAGAGRPGLDRKGREDVILAELARRVPGLLGRLAEGGGGSVSMVGRRELARVVRAAYDPASAPFLEQAELQHGDDPDYEISWGDAGPVAAQEWWDRYTHDSGYSVTWEMYEAPRSTVTEQALNGLLMPHSDFTRKRVALIYRAHAPDDAADKSEADVNTATFTASQGKGRVKAIASQRIRATEQSRQEVASGAGLLRFYVMVTATVSDGEDLIQAVSNVESRAGAVPMRLRRCYGSQAASFATTLPVGMVPWEHTAIPDKIRDLL